MTTASIPQRHSTETTIYRALLARLQTLVPPGSPAARLLEASRPVFDLPSGTPTVHFAFDEFEPPEDPVTAAMRQHPRAVALAETQRELAGMLRHSISATAWRTYLALESATNEHGSILESVVFAHAFRLGQLEPAFPRTADAMDDPVLRRLARTATDMRTPPGQRLRVLIAASAQALEELFPVATS